MKLIRISAIWCSSCLIMRSRVGELIKELPYDVEIDELDYEDEKAEELAKNFGLDIEILPIYIRTDNSKYSVGEKSKKEFREFIEE